jgi:hypothetical protein
VVSAFVFPERWEERICPISGPGRDYLPNCGFGVFGVSECMSKTTRYIPSISWEILEDGNAQSSGKLSRLSPALVIYPSTNRIRNRPRRSNGSCFVDLFRNRELVPPLGPLPGSRTRATRCWNPWRTPRPICHVRCSLIPQQTIHWPAKRDVSEPQWKIFPRAWRDESSASRTFAASGSVEICYSARISCKWYGRSGQDWWSR